MRVFLICSSFIPPFHNTKQLPQITAQEYYSKRKSKNKFRKETKLKNTILTTAQADALLESSLIEGAKWIITPKTDTVLYQGKTMNFTPLRSGGVLVEVY